MTRPATEVFTGVMNGACSVAKTPEDVAALAATGIDAIVVGSITRDAREGNPEPRWYVGDEYALNSFGMPNGGAEYYDAHLPAMIQMAHTADKALILSIADFNADNYAALAELAEIHGVDGIEINLGCPNVRDGAGNSEPIASFNPSYMTDILAKVGRIVSVPTAVKLSPYSNPDDLKQVASLVNEFSSEYIQAVVTSNTFPAAFMSDDEGAPVLKVGGGGMSGPALRPIALGQVRAFRQALAPDIAVVGVGGIETRQHVNLFRTQGAAAVQAATLIVRDGHAAIDRLIG